MVGGEKEKQNCFALIMKKPFKLELSCKKQHALPNISAIWIQKERTLAAKLTDLWLLLHQN
jgi:hypothetical protein